MRRLLILTVTLLLAPVLLSAGWNKAYFAATKPGSWATIRVTSTITTPYTTTSTRLADVDGKVVIEQRSEFNDNVSPSATMRYELAKEFNADRDLIDHLKAVVAASAKTGSDDAYTELPGDTVAALKTMATYAATATFKGVETIEGKPCDRYSYTRGKKGDAQLEKGDIWLNPTVPFGVVKHTMSFTDPSGKLLWTADSRLVDSGLKPISTTPAVAAAAAKPDLETPAAPQLMTLQTAYDSGLIKIAVEVAPEDKRGDRLNLSIETNENPLIITLLPENMTLKGDFPVERLMFRASSAHKLELAQGRPAKIVVNQLGTRRVVAGKFQLSVYEGKPVFIGSVTMDNVK